MSPPEQARRILIVEDDRDLREALTETLRDEGYEVAGAAHGREALELLRGSFRRPALILLDLTMPVMNGWQFRSHQRRDPEISGIPVVVVSADPLAVLATHTGVAAVLPKPTDPEKLLEAIGRHHAKD